MTYHICSHHSGDKPYHCPDDCKCTFSLEANLNTHCHICHQTQSVSTTSSHSTCVVCNPINHYCTTFGKSSYIIVSYCVVLVLTLEKNPSYVRTMGKVFCTFSILTQHSHIHTGEKPLICKDCGKKFAQSCDLTKHSRIHTAEKPFIYKDCGKGFTSSDSVNHCRIHIGEKTFICKAYGKGFY